MNKPPIQNIVEILKYIEPDSHDREGLYETPQRVIKSYKEMFSGYNTDLDSLVKTFDAEDHKDLVIVKDIDFYSHCEHHIVPFFGKAHIAYIPDTKIVGLSKMGRVVECFSRRLQVQERLTDQIADFLYEKLSPKFLVVAVEGAHMCMVMRGVQKINAKTFTMTTRTSKEREYNDEVQKFLRIIK